MDITRLSLIFCLSIFVACNDDGMDKVMTLTIDVIPSAESGSVTPDEGEYAHKEPITLEAVPSDGWLFSRWEGDVTTEANPLVISMYKDYHVVAIFERRWYDLTLSVEGQGRISERRARQYPSQSDVELTAIPEEGWEFTEWSEGVVGTDNPVVIRIDEAKRVTARFVRKRFDVVILVSGRGSVETDINPPKQIPFESFVNLVAYPSPRWAFLQWSGTISGTNPEYSLKMTRHASVVAEFYPVNTFVGGYGDFILGLPDEEYAVAGSGAWNNEGDFADAIGNGDLFIMAFDREGYRKWVHKYDQIPALGSVKRIPGHGYVLTGQVPSEDIGSHSRFVALKTDMSGNVSWQRQGSANASSAGLDVLASRSGHLVFMNAKTVSTHYNGSLVGHTSDLSLLKTDLNNQIVWEKTFKQAYDFNPQSIVEADNGDYIVTGLAEIPIPGYESEPGMRTYIHHVIRVDAAGNLKWSKSFEQEQMYHQVTSAITSEGYLYMSGSLKSTQSVMVRKIDGLGNELWVRYFAGNQHDEINTIAVADDGGIYVAGASTSTMGPLVDPNKLDHSNGFLMRLDAAGTLSWVRQLGGSGYDNVRSLVKSGDRLILTGLTTSTDGHFIYPGHPSPSNYYRNFVLKTDVDGNIILD